MTPSPRRNRVTPFNTIEADPARGTLMGNRGILHDAHGAMGPRRWTHPHWIACRLTFKDHWRPIARPGAWTELFFLDEATAFAAGHRPCAYCRRADYNRFVALWRKVHGGAEACAGAIDKALHATRLEGRPPHQRTFEARLGDLPTGTFVRLPLVRLDRAESCDSPPLAGLRADATARDGWGEGSPKTTVRVTEAWVRAGDRLFRWSHDGYTLNRSLDPTIMVDVLTPAPFVEVFRAGYVPDLHPSAAVPYPPTIRLGSAAV